MKCISQVLAAWMFMCAGAAMAAPATEEGAARLRAVFGRYLGQAANVVTVTPTGATYLLKIDPAPLTTIAEAQGAHFSMSPFDMTLSDLDGGKWQVTQKGPFAMAIDLPHALKLDLKIADLTQTGIFDEAIIAFATSDAGMSGLAVDETVSDASGKANHVTYMLESVSAKTTGAAGSAGGVDGTMRYVASGLRETFDMPAGTEGGAPVEITVTAESYDTDGAFRGVRTDGLFKLWGWLVAHPDEAAIRENFGEMKAIGRDLLPGFDSVSATGALSGLKVMTPFGEGSAALVEVALDANGVVANGKLREKVAVSGLQVPTEMMPDWVPALLPDRVAFDATGEGFNLLAPAQILIDAARFGEAIPPDIQDQMARAFLPADGMTVRLTSTGASGPSFGVNIDADTRVQEAGPAGTANITATGLDAVSAALAKAPPEIGSQMLLGLSMVRGMGKDDGQGKVTWALEFARDKFIVNGTDMGAMMGIGTAP